MRIAFISLQYDPFIRSGAGIFVSNITKALVREGQEVHVFTAQSNKNDALCEDVDGVIVHRVKCLNVRYLVAPSFWLNLNKTFKSVSKDLGGFDIIHSDTADDFFLLRNPTTVPRIVTVHHINRDAVQKTKQTFFNRLKDFGSENGFAAWAQEVCIKRADLLVAVSNYTKNRLIDMYNINGDKIKVVFNGLSREIFPMSENELQNIKDKYGVPDKKVILFVGNIQERKGIGNLIEAFKLISEKVDSVLVIVGSGRSDAYIATIERLGVRSNVIFTGRVDDKDLIGFYHIADVFVLPSLLEGFGLVILEAMAAGKPIIASNSGGIPEIVESGVHGDLVEPGDYHSFAISILKYLTDDSLRGTVGSKNRAYAQRNFSYQQSAKNLVSIYSKLL